MGETKLDGSAKGILENGRWCTSHRSCAGEEENPQRRNLGKEKRDFLIGLKHKKKKLI